MSLLAALIKALPEHTKEALSLLKKAVGRATHEAPRSNALYSFDRQRERLVRALQSMEKSTAADAAKKVDGALHEALSATTPAYRKGREPVFEDLMAQLKGGSPTLTELGEAQSMGQRGAKVKTFERVHMPDDLRQKASRHHREVGETFETDIDASAAKAYTDTERGGKVSLVQIKGGPHDGHWTPVVPSERRLANSKSSHIDVSGEVFDPLLVPRADGQPGREARTFKTLDEGKEWFNNEGKDALGSTEANNMPANWKDYAPRVDKKDHPLVKEHKLQDPDFMAKKSRLQAIDKFDTEKFDVYQPKQKQFPDPHSGRVGKEILESDMPESGYSKLYGKDAPRGDDKRGTMYGKTKVESPFPGKPTDVHLEVDKQLRMDGNEAWVPPMHEPKGPFPGLPPHQYPGSTGQIPGETHRVMKTVPGPGVKEEFTHFQDLDEYSHKPVAKSVPGREREVAPPDSIKTRPRDMEEVEYERARGREYQDEGHYQDSIDRPQRSVNKTPGETAIRRFDEGEADGLPEETHFVDSKGRPRRKRQAYYSDLDGMHSLLGPGLFAALFGGGAAAVAAEDDA